MEDLKSPKVIWLTGLSGAGKSTLSDLLYNELIKDKTILIKQLDGDLLREGINKGLGFSDEDRLENIRRAAEVAKLFRESGFHVICSFITPLETMRTLAKSIIGLENYIEIFVDCSIETCEKRDVKGLYQKAREGKINNFTGISSGFEIPTNPNFKINTDNISKEDSLKELISYLEL
jgi:adenylylsulfate kinase